MPSANRSANQDATAQAVKAMFAHMAGLDDAALADLLATVSDPGILARRILDIVGDPGHQASREAQRIISRVRGMDAVDFTTWVGDLAQGRVMGEMSSMSDSQRERQVAIEREAILHPEVVVRAQAALSTARERAVGSLKQLQAELAEWGRRERETNEEVDFEAVDELRGRVRRVEGFVTAANRLLAEVDGKASAIRAARGEAKSGRSNYHQQSLEELGRRRARELVAIRRELIAADRAKRAAERAAHQAKQKQAAANRASNTGWPRRVATQESDGAQ